MSHGGKADVMKHINMQKHINNVHCIEKNQKLLFAVDNSEQSIINAECLFSAFLVEHNLLLSASDHDVSGQSDRKEICMCEDKDYCNS